MSSKDAPAPNRLIRILRLPDVCRLTGLKRAMIYQLQAEKRFPHSVKLGARAVGWLEHEVQEWLVARIDESRAPQKVSFVALQNPRGRPRGR